MTTMGYYLNPLDGNKEVNLQCQEQANIEEIATFNIISLESILKTIDPLLKVENADTPQ